jgi:hypothetical protein
MPILNTKYVHIHLKFDWFLSHMSECYNTLRTQWSSKEHSILLHHYFFSSSFFCASPHIYFLIFHQLEALPLFSIDCSPFGSNKSDRAICGLMFLKLLVLYYLLPEKIHLVHFVKMYLVIMNQGKYCFN